MITSTVSSTTNTDLAALHAGILSGVEKALADQVEITNEHVARLTARIDAQDKAHARLAAKHAELATKLDVANELHQQQINEMVAAFDAKLAAAVPCATFESGVNAAGEVICTLKVDQVQSLRRL